MNHSVQPHHTGVRKDVQGSPAAHLLSAAIQMKLNSPAASSVVPVLKTMFISSQQTRLQELQLKLLRQKVRQMEKQIEALEDSRPNR